MDIKKIAVLGTGTMGHGIACLCAKKGLKVNMYGRSDKSLERGFNNIKKDLEYLRRYKGANKEKCTELLSYIKGVKTIEGAVEEADFVIESLAEDLELKQKVFEQLDDICKKNVILATNTSGLSPTKISKYMNNHKERMIVTHFWNPPQFIPLVEIVPGEKTSIKTVNETEKFIKYLNKVPVRMNKECPGFIGNRLQLALLREALYIVEQGWANPEEVDKAVEYGFGRRLPASGPLASADLGGIDVFNNISKYLFKELCDYSEGSNILNDLVKQGKVGTKSGEGIYNWDERQIELIETKRNELLLYLFDK